MRRFQGKIENNEEVDHYGIQNRTSSHAMRINMEALKHYIFLNIRLVWTSYLVFPITRNYIYFNALIGACFCSIEDNPR